MPYIDSLFTDMKSRFSDMVVKLLVSSSIFNPALLPSEEEEFSQYRKEEIKAFSQFYGSKATVSYDNEKKKALRLLMERKKITEMPLMWEIEVHIECTGAYTGCFQKLLIC